MDKKQLCKKVTDKLLLQGVEVSEDLVEAIYMWEMKQVRDSLTHPERNNIFIPDMGTFNFKKYSAAGVVQKYASKVEVLKKELEVEEDVRKVASLTSKIEMLTSSINTMLKKLHFKSEKYGGHREINEYHRAKKKYGGIPDIINLLNEREINYQELVDYMAKQGGDTQGLDELSDEEEHLLSEGEIEDMPDMPVI